MVPYAFTIPFMPLSELELPDYRTQLAEVAARFARIRERPLILSVRKLCKSFATDGGPHVVSDRVSLDIHRREPICVIVRDP